MPLRQILLRACLSGGLALAPVAGSARTDETQAARQKAQSGDPEAQWRLGIMYLLGRGAPQSDIKAVEWFHAAAEQGEARAQFSLGYMYNEGRGVPQNVGEAGRWYRRAAEQGQGKAQFLLGPCMQMEWGSPKP